ncbi:hypothetical protein NK718_07100 [Alsobacter sp. SYSU M60028]|uniref:Uncharacterized protein n=1 Tax=Alsobacter ponti TaxID=2962936 RepID=A0ABT1LB39_9HYPH|nr:hypothetical protein [Alsobacter ponti]MCP8938278.1 hypothetical protein [Alsobacter ponti]
MVDTDLKGKAKALPFFLGGAAKPRLGDQTSRANTWSLLHEDLRVGPQLRAKFFSQIAALTT